MTSDLADRTVLVTGATGAIGSAVAHTLTERGARIVAVARRERALRDLVANVPGGGHVPLALDVADIEAWERHGAHLQGVTDVVCAAAILKPVGELGTYDPRDFADTLTINVVGALCAVHFCLHGLTTARGAVVFLSGGGATAALPRYDAYATSKAAIVRLAENLAMVLAPQVRVNAVAPGFVASGMHEATLQAGPERAGAEYHERTIRQLADGGFPPQEAAELVALLLSGAAGKVTGRLISAQWDPWRDPAFFGRLAAEPDLGTLRRIDDVFFVAAHK